MKPLLFAYFACVFSVAWFGGFKQYRLMIAFLLLAVAAAASLSFPLHPGYPVLMGATAAFRLLAGLEILHRQTYPFRYWGRLNGIAWILAGLFAGVCWLMRSSPIAGEVVELRRLSQIWMALVFLIVELLWIALGGGWYRKVDLIAAAWGIMALNHGASSLLALSGRWQDWGRWWDAQPWMWGIDAISFGVLAVLFSGIPVSLLLLQAASELLRRCFGASTSRH